MQIDALHEKVEKLEEKHDISSEDFQEKFDSGELGDEKDFIEWDIYLDLIDELEQT